MKPKYIVSACLIGCECRYDGKHQKRNSMVDLYTKGEAIAVCPEELAGLGTPRSPCEKKGSKIISNLGEDKTVEYQKGAKKAIESFEGLEIKKAYLKSKSPMCGNGKIYDGTFTGKLTEGSGVFAELILKLGIEIESIE